MVDEDDIYNNERQGLLSTAGLTLLHTIIKYKLRFSASLTCAKFSLPIRPWMLVITSLNITSIHVYILPCVATAGCRHRFWDCRLKLLQNLTYSDRLCHSSAVEQGTSDGESLGHYKLNRYDTTPPTVIGATSAEIY